MSKVLFYHYTESKLYNILPKLVERSLQRSWRVTIQFVTEECRDTIDVLLWTWSDFSFIGHGTEQNKWPEEQPVFLTTSISNPNAAHVRFCIEGAQCSEPDGYERLVIMFDGGNIEQLTRAREEWKNLKSRGYSLTYWQEILKGHWKKKGPHV